MTETMMRTPQTHVKEESGGVAKTLRRELPLFLTEDKEKIQHVRALFELGHKMNFEVRKERIIPKSVFDKIDGICNEEEMAIMRKVNERLLDKHIVVNVADALDMTVKNAVLERPDLRNGIAIINDFTYTFSEFDSFGGTARDIKKALKRVLARINDGTSTQHTIGSIMTPYLPIPFEGSKLDYGTWGRPALIDENIGRHELDLTASLVKVDSIRRFTVPDKPHSGFWHKDVTDEVQKVVAESGLNDGYALVTTLHTTIGMIKMDPAKMKSLHRDLLEVAPEDPAQYYHNRLSSKGVLELRKDGKPLGDLNGQSHVMASLIGFYTLVQFKGGKLQLDGNDRILHIDCDTLPPRERGAAVSIIGTKELEPSEGQVN